MSVIRGITITLAVFAVSASAYDYSSYNSRSCTASNARCAGAPGKPFIQYAPCCDKSMTCSPMPNASAEQWGRYCIAPAAPAPGEAPKCYSTGERCMGAPGMPYVEYRKCCTAGDSCSTKAGEWGGFCQSGSGSSDPTSPTYGKKCYNSGERCMGETGYPYVKYMSCCESGDSCVKSTTTWGSFCSSSAPPAATTAAPVETTAAPAVTEPYVPKGYYGAVTAAPPTAAPATTSVLEGILAALPGLPTDFGCNSGSEPPASANTQPPFVPTDDQTVLELSIPIDVCATTVLTFSDADAQAFCAATLAQISSVDPTAECRYVSVEAGTVGRQLAEDDLDIAERQFGGVILIIQIICATSVYTAILLILGPIVVFLGGFISPLPTITADA